MRSESKQSARTVKSRAGTSFTVCGARALEYNPYAKHSTRAEFCAYFNVIASGYKASLRDSRNLRKIKSKGNSTTNENYAE